LPLLSIAHIEGVAVAIATNDQDARPGIDVEAIAPRSNGFEAIAYSSGERNLLDLASRTGDRDEWIARFWCAKEAAAKSSGLGMIDGPSSVEIVGLGPRNGEMLVAYGPGLSDQLPAPIVVTSERRGDFAWAWTLGRGRPES
jgi:phosphopantetheinyl transferase